MQDIFGTLRNEHPKGYTVIHWIRPYKSKCSRRFKNCRDRIPPLGPHDLSHMSVYVLCLFFSIQYICTGKESIWSWQKRWGEVFQSDVLQPLSSGEVGYSLIFPIYYENYMNLWTEMLQMYFTLLSVYICPYLKMGIFFSLNV